MITLRDYQFDNGGKAAALLKEYGIAYLSMEVRTGKTLTALHAAELYGAKSVLCLTKKKAISSIQADYDGYAPPFAFHVTNYEQLHTIDGSEYDLVICDEAHCLGQFPKPAKRTVLLKAVCRRKSVIYLSGTPTPESYSQIFHQLWVSGRSPFPHDSFYAWANDYVRIEVRSINGLESNDYSMASGVTVRDLEYKLRSRNTPEEQKPLIRQQIARVKQEIADKVAKIKAAVRHLFISFSQQDAGFMQDVKEEVIPIEMDKLTYNLADRLRKDRVVIGNNGAEILADTEVKLMGKLHQIYSGTIIPEGTDSPIVFDCTKADFILTAFAGRKIAVFYKFRGELAMLQKVFGERLTDSPDVFREAGHERIFCSQIQSGREGVNLSTADCIVMLNIDFASVSYQQVKARLQDKNRLAECRLYWLFSNGGIEHRVYQAVTGKADYTVSYFRKDFSIRQTPKSV